MSVLMLIWRLMGNFELDIPWAILVAGRKVLVELWEECVDALLVEMTEANVLRMAREGVWKGSQMEKVRKESKRKRERSAACVYEKREKKDLRSCL